MAEAAKIVHASRPTQQASFFCKHSSNQLRCQRAFTFRLFNANTEKGGTEDANVSGRTGTDGSLNPLWCVVGWIMDTDTKPNERNQ